MPRYIVDIVVITIFLIAPPVLATPLPEFFGIYLVADDKLIELEQQETRVAGMLTPQVTVRGIAHFMGPSVKDRSAYFLFYGDNLPRELARLSKLVYKRDVMVGEMFGKKKVLNIGFLMPKCPGNCIASIDHFIKLRLRITSLTELPNAFRLVPADPLEDGIYAIYFAEPAIEKFYVFGVKANEANIEEKLITPKGLVLKSADSNGMVHLSEGTFQMGELSTVAVSTDREPFHTVNLSSFYILDHEVTLGEYREYDSSHRVIGCDSESCPVTNVSWEDAQNYIDWLNTNAPPSNGTTYRLCTEAEWEYAARAGTTTKWSCGNDKSCLSDVAWYSDNSGNRVHEIKGKSANAFGLYDMHGNVFEWVQDWYGEDYYSWSPSSNPTGPTSGLYRVMRGGSYTHIVSTMMSAFRFPNPPLLRHDFFGGPISFRLCSSKP